MKDEATREAGKRLLSHILFWKKNAKTGYCPRKRFL